MRRNQRDDWSPEVPQVVVSVGTDIHRFDRLMTWVDRWAADRSETSIQVQRGTSYAPRRLESVELLPHADLLRLFTSAAAVVCHGGPSTVMDARQSGRLPIVVARDPAFGEHVDDHQLRFANHLDRHGLARVVDSEEELCRSIDEALADPVAFAVSVGADTAVGVVEFAKAVDDLLGNSEV